MRDIPSFRAISYERLRRCATTYNDFGDVVSESVSGLYTKTLSRHRDSYGRELGYTLDNSRKNIIEYEIDTGRTKRVMFAGAWYAYGYLPGTDLKSSLMVGSAGRTDWTYEPTRDLLTQVKNTAFGNVVSQYDYVNDAIGRRTEMARGGSRMTESRNDIYGYNSRNELTNAVKNATLNEYAYQYDDIGNRLSSLDLGEGREYESNNLNQYVSIAEGEDDFVPQFDLDGNQTLVRTSTGVWQVAYNGENRPVSWTCGSTNIFMKFDRMGRRVQYVESVNGVTNNIHRFVYDGYLCVQRLNALSNNTVDLAFGWDPTEPVATRPLWMQRVSGTYNFFYFHDGNKNVSDLVSYQSVRGVPAHYEYAPFGALTDATTNTAFTAFNVAEANPFRFSSEYADDALWLVYYNYRHYEPVTGRWLSRDAAEPELYLWCANYTWDSDVMGMYRMISGMLYSTNSLPGENELRLKILKEIRYINDIMQPSCYSVKLRDLEFATAEEINKAAKEKNTEVLVIGHGDQSVSYCLQNGVRIHVSTLSVDSRNLFGCYISPRVRGKDKDNYQNLYAGFLARLIELTPTMDECCEKKKVIIYEGEVVKASDKYLRQTATQGSAYLWHKISDEEAIAREKERKDDLLYWKSKNN